MKLSIKLLAAALVVALAVPAALAGAVMQATPAWEVSGGSTTGMKPWPPESGSLATVSWTGKISPALGSGQGGTIGSVEFVCPGGNQPLPPGSFMGSAQGSTFSIDIKQAALIGTHCSKELKVCFTMFGYSKPEECVTVASPIAFTVPTIDYGGLVRLPQHEVELGVKIIDRFGEVNESYFGQAIVSVRSEGGGVMLNGAWGQAVVTIADGVGTLLVDASTVPSGGLVTFDLVADRTDPSRASIEVQ